MWKEFKQFASRGNVIDLAVGVIIGAAFGKIVTSLVTDVVMPPIGLVIGRVDFKNLYIALNGQTYANLAEAQKAGAPTINYGVFLNSVVEFADRRVRRVPARAPGEQADAAAGRRPRRAAPRLPVLRLVDPRPRAPLPALHVGSRAPDPPIDIR